MRKIYRKIIPLKYREWVKEYQVYQGYQKLRRHRGHTYQCFEATKSIFIHIPKAGGISIIKSLYGDQAGGFGHPTYMRFLKLFGKKRFDAYYKFTFVRNPWDRLHSAYGFLKKGGMNQQDKRFSDEVMSQVNTFEEFVMQWLTPERVNAWVHFIPQYKYITNTNGEIVVDFVGRFEDFETDFITINKHIGVNQSLIHLNKTKDKKVFNYSEVYTTEMMEKVALLYKKDAELFNYEF